MAEKSFQNETLNHIDTIANSVKLSKNECQHIVTIDQFLSSDNIEKCRFGKMKREGASLWRVVKYTLQKFPQAANISENKLSILAPLGIALIGYRKGDIIEWPVPSGIRKLKVDEIIYQPEAAGNFNL